MKQNGTTLVEVIVATAIFMVIVGTASYYHWSIVRQTGLDSYVNTFMQAAAEARNAAMAGRTHNGIIAPFGIHLENNRYVYFAGNQYVSGQEGNIATQLPSYLTLDYSRWPSQDIIFAADTGEITNFSPNQNQLIFRDNQNRQKTLLLNQYGVIESQ